MEQGSDKSVKRIGTSNLWPLNVSEARQQRMSHILSLVKRPDKLEHLVRKAILHEKRKGEGFLFPSLTTSTPQFPNSNVYLSHIDNMMTSRNQSASDSLPAATTYGVSTAVPSNVTPSTLSPSADHQSPDPTENQAGSALRALASMMHHGQDSKYYIRYFEDGVYDSIKAPSTCDGGNSHVKAHEEAMRILLGDLNRTSALDKNDPDRDVKAMVKLYNENHNKTDVSLYDAKSHSGSSPAWDASISIASKSVANRVGKRVVDKMSSGTGRTGSVLNRLRKPGWEGL